MPIQPVSGEIKAQPLNENFSYLDSKTNNISKGSPAGTFLSLNALKAEYPNGNTNVYVVSGDGKWYYWNGTSWVPGGQYQATGLATGSVTPDKLSSSYAYAGQVTAGEDVNTIRAQGAYLINANALNIPSGIKSSTHLLNENLNDRWMMQTIINYNSNNEITKIWMRRFDVTHSMIPEWTVIFDSDIKYRKDVSVKSGQDLNIIDSNEELFVSSAVNNPSGSSNAGFLSNFYGSSLFRLQKYFDRSGNYYFRFLDLASNPEPSKIAFKRILTSDDLQAVNKPLSGKKVVNFGDSIIGNKRPPLDMSTTVSSITGATVYNCGFGGCRMSYGKYPRPWEAFSMVGLSEAIVNGTWTAQDEAIADTSQGYPAYFPETLALLKSLNFDEIDYVTIRYGTNDWNADVNLDNDQNKYDTEYYGGSLRTALELILQKYPHIRILIQTPGYRFYLDNNEDFIEDSDTKRNSHNLLLTQYVELCKSIAKDYKIPCQDDYYNLGFNKYNRKAYFDGVDGTHPNVTGTKILGEKTAYSLINLV